jgi:VWFA-related protein
MKQARHARGFVMVITTLLAAGYLAAPSAQDASPQAQQTFRSAVDVVTIQASVRDRRGRVLNGLTTTDFEVRDNGELRPILSVRADRQSPLSVAILVDMSGSMAVAPKTVMARQAYESIVSELRDGQDEVGLFIFDSSLHERRSFTRRLSVLKGALDDFEAFGTTSLYDATAAAARELAARSAALKAIIVLTDGIDTSSTLTARDVSALAGSIDVPVFMVATVPSVDQRLMMEEAERATAADTADLRDLADWTGGQFVFASTLVETATAASHLIGELRQQYVLAIEAASGREWRRLDVRVRRGAAVVKARSGYYAG